MVRGADCERGRWRSVLSDRRQRVLAALIEEYVARALPVGSRTLTERYQLGVSPATVRNELSVLEDGGYITQPHTSAGRVPTDFGYRAFVDNLLSCDLAADDERYRPVVDELRRLQEGLRHIETEGGLSCSIGALPVAEEQSAEELYQSADRLLYQAKEQGRDQYVIGPAEEPAADGQSV